MQTKNYKKIIKTLKYSRFIVFDIYEMSYYNMAMNISNKIKQIFLLLGDIVVLYASLYLTLVLRYRELPDIIRWQTHFDIFTLLFIGWILIFYISGLYSLRIAINNAKFFEITLSSIAIAFALSIAVFYILPDNNVTPKTNLVIFGLVFFCLFFLWRRLFNRSLEAYLPKNNIVIIGYSPEVKELIKEFKLKPHLGQNIVAIIDKNLNLETIEGIPIKADINDLSQEISHMKINTLVLKTDPRDSDELRAFLFSILALNLRYVSLPNFYEETTGKVPVDAINAMWFLDNLKNSEKYWFDAFKRLYDVVLSAVILIITAIFWPLIAIMIKAGSRGPIFFRQKRIGINGQEFNIIKFRTMKEEGNDRLPTATNDARITGLGKFLRKTRLDEIPQVLNILKGEMSFVGPRPERPELIEQLEKDVPFYRERLLVKPGATGSDQVSGEYHSPSREDSLKKLQYDLFYIKNRSIYLDLTIILKTIRTMISSKGV